MLPTAAGKGVTDTHGTFSIDPNCNTMGGMISATIVWSRDKRKPLDMIAATVGHTWSETYVKWKIKEANSPTSAHLHPLISRGGEDTPAALTAFSSSVTAIVREVSMPCSCPRTSVFVQFP